MAIRIEHLHKRFGAFAALDGIDLEIRQGASCWPCSGLQVRARPRCCA